MKVEAERLPTIAVMECVSEFKERERVTKAKGKK